MPGAYGAAMPARDLPKEGSAWDELLPSTAMGGVTFITVGGMGAGASGSCTTSAGSDECLGVCGNHNNAYVSAQCALMASKDGAGGEGIATSAAAEAAAAAALGNTRVPPGAMRADADIVALLLLLPVSTRTPGSACAVSSVSASGFTLASTLCERRHGGWIGTLSTTPPPTGAGCSVAAPFPPFAGAGVEAAAFAGAAAALGDLMPEAAAAGAA